MVHTTVTGFLLNRSTNTYNGTLTVNNTSGSPISGPLTVGLPNLTANVTLSNGGGTFNDDPFIALAAGPLAAGQSASVVLKFSTFSAPRVGLL